MVAIRAFTACQDGARTPRDRQSLRISLCSRLMLGFWRVE
jgi:hypothetical protein